MEYEDRIPLLPGYQWPDEQQRRALHPLVLVQIPNHTDLTDAAKETIRHLCRYYRKQDGFVLLSDRVAVLVSGNTASDMAAQANQEADAVEIGNSARDFLAIDTDDGCGLLQLGDGKLVVFRPFAIHHDHRGWGPELDAREECLWACARSEIEVIVFYNNLLNL